MNKLNGIKSLWMPFRSASDIIEYGTRRCACFATSSASVISGSPGSDVLIEAPEESYSSGGTSDRGGMGSSDIGGSGGKDSSPSRPLLLSLWGIGVVSQKRSKGSTLGAWLKLSRSRWNLGRPLVYGLALAYVGFMLQVFRATSVALVCQASILPWEPIDNAKILLALPQLSSEPTQV